MARTREQWEDAINVYATINELSASTVAEWKLLRDCIVTIAIIFEAILEFFQTDIDNKLATKQPATLGWYVQIAKEFQLGDSLTVENGVVKYEVIDISKQIIKHAAPKETDDNYIKLLLAKEDGQLDNDELVAFKNYIKARRAPGTKVTPVSLPPDVVKYTLIALFDPTKDKTALTVALTYVFYSV